MILRSSSELPVGSSPLRLGLLGLTAILAVLAVACSLLVSYYQQSLIEASRYNGAFDLSQAVVELLRFEVALADDKGDAAAARQVDLRFGILRNRVAVIEGNGSFDDDELAPFRGLKAALDQIGSLLSKGATATTLAASAELLQPFVGQLLRSASRAHSASGDVVMHNQQALRSLLIAISAITLTLVVVGAALIVLVLRQYRRLDAVARTDALTGLANRLAFNQALRTTSDRHCAVALVDVDHFKAVNDTLGHHAGDGLLCTLTQRLQAAAQGATVLARIGGDEFAALFSGSDAAARCVAFAGRIQDKMREPVVLEDRKVEITVTQGLCIAPPGSNASLFNDADIALFAAKAAGRNCHRLFEPALKHAFARRQSLTDDMRHAVARGEFFLVYQPIVRLTDGELQGVEALLRWNHPHLGLISPAEFIPIAEENGVIQEVGRWVISEACRQAASWPRCLFVAVNVSARQLMDPSLIEHVAHNLAVHGLSQGRLEIEITESILIERDQAALSILNRLRALGCRIALDDFGTGYASLSYLRRFPFDKLKIDQSFVRDSGANGDGEVIVAMICVLAERLGLSIVAEGIETQEQRDAIQSAGGQLGQGYYFHRPMQASAIEQLFAQEQAPDDRDLVPT